MKVERYLLFLFMIIVLACENKDTELNARMDELLDETESKPDSLFQVCESIKERSFTSAKEKALMSFILSKIHYDRDENKKAFDEIENALSCKKVKGKLLEEFISLGSYIYFNTADYEKALACNLKLLDWARERKNHKKEVMLHIVMSRIYFVDQEYKQAKQSIGKAKEIAYQLRDTNLICKVLLREGAYWGEKKDYENAIETLQEAHTLAKRSGNESNCRISEGNLAMCYMYSGKLDDALKIFRKQLPVFEKMSSRKNMVRTYRNTGWALHLKGESDSAIVYLKKANKMAEKYNFRHMNGNANSTLAQIYKDRGDYENTFHHFYRYAQIKDSLLLEDKATKLAQLKEKYEQDKRVYKVKEQEKKKRFLYLFCFSILILGLLSILLIYRLISQKKIYREMQKTQKLEWELRSKREQIFDFTTRLKEKYRIMLDLQQELQLAQKNGEYCYRRMSHALKVHLQSEDTRNLLEEKVEKGNEEFFKQVKENHPDLTKDDLNLIGLLRLDFSSKQIAEIFNTSEKAIEGRRYRLRKKMGVESKLNLVEYFQSFSS